MGETLRNILNGMGSVLEIMPPPRPRRTVSTPWRTDLEALQGDWHAVGEDLARSIAKANGEAADGERRQHQPRP